MFEIRTFADATLEAVQPTQVNNSAALRVAARKAVQGASWRTVQVLAFCMALFAMLLSSASQAQAQVYVGGVQSQIASGTWTGRWAWPRIRAVTSTSRRTPWGRS